MVRSDYVNIREISKATVSSDKYRRGLVSRTFRETADTDFFFLFRKKMMIMIIALAFFLFFRKKMMTMMQPKKMMTMTDQAHKKTPERTNPPGQ
tara:strand:- start:12468 stop:12749 length:282 start_codon:yes stop_codon:yes gene_type:complete